MSEQTIRERAEWAIEYGSHSSDVTEANAECEQFGRDVLALLDALNGFQWLGKNIHNIKEDPEMFRRMFVAALEDARKAVQP